MKWSLGGLIFSFCILNCTLANAWPWKTYQTCDSSELEALETYSDADDIPPINPFPYNRCRIEKWGDQWDPTYFSFGFIFGTDLGSRHLSLTCWHTDVGRFKDDLRIPIQVSSWFVGLVTHIQATGSTGRKFKFFNLKGKSLSDMFRTYWGIRAGADVFMGNGGSVLTNDKKIYLILSPNSLLPTTGLGATLAVKKLKLKIDKEIFASLDSEQRNTINNLMDSVFSNDLRFE
jgi:hypothetical protein